ncbi:hypothetical protein [Streptomyces orinoci]|uniref:Secreted protein n=1 Tax=Streptomyces orinoci TaxID=67339 RepID=A0ABV3K5G8_STRON|nr:hypothetical protein [Streptomyces orinoci]
MRRAIVTMAIAASLAVPALLGTAATATAAPNVSVLLCILGHGRPSFIQTCVGGDYDGQPLG